MSIRLPQNKLQYNYTAGKEYILANSYEEYIGYYFLMGSKIYAGRNFDFNSPELLKMDSDRINELMLNPATSLYAKISKITIPTTDDIPSFIFSPTEEDLNQSYMLRYFAKKLGSNPILIKEINKETFDRLQSNSLYQTLKVEFTYNMSDEQNKKLEEQMPGITSFMDSDPITSRDETPISSLIIKSPDLVARVF